MHGLSSGQLLMSYMYVQQHLVFHCRKYDIRVSLRNIERVSTTDPSLQRFISSTLRMSESGIIHYNPKASNEEWSLTYIRHQLRESFNFRDSKYMVEIADVGEYLIKEGDFNEHHIGPKNFKPCHEVEVRVTCFDVFKLRAVKDWASILWELE